MVVTGALVATLANGARAALACSPAYLTELANDDDRDRLIREALEHLDDERWTRTADGGWVRSSQVVALHFIPAPTPAPAGAAHDPQGDAA